MNGQARSGDSNKSDTVDQISSGLLQNKEVKRAMTAKRFGYYPEDGKMFEELSANADDKLFKNIESNNNHVLHHLLPRKNITQYKLRDRMHNYTLPAKDDRNFINRIIYKNLRLK